MRRAAVGLCRAPQGAGPTSRGIAGKRRAAPHPDVHSYRLRGCPIPTAAVPTSKAQAPPPAGQPQPRRSNTCRTRGTKASRWGQPSRAAGPGGCMRRSGQQKLPVGDRSERAALASVTLPWTVDVAPRMLSGETFGDQDLLAFGRPRLVNALPSQGPAALKLRKRANSSSAPPVPHIREPRSCRILAFSLGSLGAP